MRGLAVGGVCFLLTTAGCGLMAKQPVKDSALSTMRAAAIAQEDHRRCMAAPDSAENQRLCDDVQNKLDRICAQSQALAESADATAEEMEEYQCPAQR